MAETPDKATQGSKPPELPQQVASSRVPAIMVSLAALAIIGAATANSLPSFSRLSLPSFDRISLPNFDRVALPDFNRFSWPSFSWPNFNRFAAKPAPKTVSVPIPDPVVTAALKEIQLSQQQNAAVLVSLTQSSATQQADLKRISRQLTSLSTQADALQNSMMPLTTSSIPHSSIPHPNMRARILRPSRKIASPQPPPLPKPVGPVSVGGAPLSPAPTPGSSSSPS